MNWADLDWPETKAIITAQWGTVATLAAQISTDQGAVVTSAAIRRAVKRGQSRCRWPGNGNGWLYLRPEDVIGYLAPPPVVDCSQLLETLVAVCTGLQRYRSGIAVRVNSGRYQLALVRDDHLVRQSPLNLRQEDRG